MDILKKCNLCNHNCLVNRHLKTGICGCSDKMIIARASLHFWEEPCISGKNGSGTIFFSGCNLRCVFCQNYQISNKIIGHEVSVKDFAKICINLEKQGAHNINLVSPTCYVPLIIDGIKLAKKLGLSIPIVYNTSSYENVDTIKMLDGIVDIYLPDLKFFNDSYAIKYSHAKDYFKVATNAINEMYKQVGNIKFNKDNMMTKGVIVRHLMMPGLTDDTKEILNYLYNTYHDNIYISIMNQYTKVKNFDYFKELNETIKEEDYDKIINYAIDLGIKNAFIQEGGTDSKSFIPDFLNQDLPL